MLSAKDATQAVAMMRLGAIEFCAGVCVHWTRHGACEWISSAQAERRTKDKEPLGD